MDINNKIVVSMEDSIKYTKFAFDVFEWLKTTEILKELPEVSLFINNDINYIPDGNSKTLYGGSTPGIVIVYMMNILNSFGGECDRQNVGPELRDEIIKHEILGVMVHEIYHFYKPNDFGRYGNSALYYKWVEDMVDYNTDLFLVKYKDIILERFGINNYEFSDDTREDKMKKYNMLQVYNHNMQQQASVALLYCRISSFIDDPDILDLVIQNPNIEVGLPMYDDGDYECFELRKNWNIDICEIYKLTSMLYYLNRSNRSATIYKRDDGSIFIKIEYPNYSIKPYRSALYRPYYRI